MRFNAALRDARPVASAIPSNPPPRPPAKYSAATGQLIRPDSPKLIAVVRPKAPTASNEEPMAQIIGMPVENRRPRTIRNPPPIPKKPDNAPTPSAALATGNGLRVLGFQSWQTLRVEAGEIAPAT